MLHNACAVLAWGDFNDYKCVEHILSILHGSMIWTVARLLDGLRVV